MNTITPASAHHFLNNVELPESSSGFEAIDRGPVIDFDAQKNQAMVVASDIVSFVKGVSAERRQDIANCSLLAQLAANKKVPDKTRIIDWYKAYFDVLENLGWVLQDKGFSSYKEHADGLEAHEAIIKVATVLLGPAPTALALVVSTLEAMKSMDPNKPWITLFDRESKTLNTAHFQVSLAQPGENDDFFITMMAFTLKAESILTQVLFFKIRKDRVELENCSGKVTVNDTVLESIRDKIKDKIKAYTNEYIAALPDL
ncbi:hypothetical protein SAMN05216404_10496 [Nitrosospira multiformis]|uniref:Virulence factor Evf domain-containing protein n=1 Tax=Nitrosospira multiformis TaxID=1231 RepID=A0A1H8G528_9PROT|nr:hypothetical protein [Nitrosospira multiformis]SEN38989.1 hypothetical protein SAMN05216404_10496 [Nitrosospira multiformis]